MILERSKDAVARAILSSGAWRGLMPRQSEGTYCLIVNFHSIIDSDFRALRRGPSVHTPVERFEDFIRLATTVFQPISLDKLVEHVDRKEPFEQNCIAITFDDGYRNNLELAAPILRRYNVPATVFVAVDYIGGGKMLPMDRLTAIVNQSPQQMILLDRPIALRLDCASVEGKRASCAALATEIKKRPASEWGGIIDHLQDRAGLDTSEIENPMLTWDEAVQMTRQGVAIASHGCTHRLMTAIPHDEAVAEIVRSYQVIKDRIGIAPLHFAYPNGRDTDFNDELRMAANEAGYKSVLSCERRATMIGRSRSNSLGRFGMIGSPARSLVYLLRYATRQLRDRGRS